MIFLLSDVDWINPNYIISYRNVKVKKEPWYLSFTKIKNIFKKSIDKKQCVCYNIQVRVRPHLCECSSMVEFQPSKLAAWVRFPSLAPKGDRKGTGDVPLAQPDRATAF